MIILGIIVISFFCIFFIVRPLLATEAQSDEAANQLEEIQVSEQQDLIRFLESLEFERARGLISEDEFAKQQAKVNRRLEQIGRMDTSNSQDGA